WRRMPRMTRMRSATMRMRRVAQKGKCSISSIAAFSLRSSASLSSGSSSSLRASDIRLEISRSFRLSRGILLHLVGLDEIATDFLRDAKRRLAEGGGGHGVVLLL